MPDISKVSNASFIPVDKVIYRVEGSFVVGSVPAGEHYSVSITNPIGEIHPIEGLYQRNDGPWFTDLSHPVEVVSGVDYTKIADIMAICTVSNIIIRVGQYGQQAGDTINYKLAILFKEPDM